MRLKFEWEGEAVLRDIRSEEEKRQMCEQFTGKIKKQSQKVFPLMQRHYTYYSDILYVRKILPT